MAVAQGSQAGSAMGLTRSPAVVTKEEVGGQHKPNGRLQYGCIHHAHLRPNSYPALGHWEFDSTQGKGSSVSQQAHTCHRLTRSEQAQHASLTWRGPTCCVTARSMPGQADGLTSTLLGLVRSAAGAREPQGNGGLALAVGLSASMPDRLVVCLINCKPQNGVTNGGAMAGQHGASRKCS